MTEALNVRRVVVASLGSLVAVSLSLGTVGAGAAAGFQRQSVQAGVRTDVVGVAPAAANSSAARAMTRTIGRSPGGSITANASGPDCLFNGVDPVVNPILSGVTPGQVISLNCTGFPVSDQLVAVELSPLALSGPASQAPNESDLADAESAVTDSQGDASGNFTIPNPFTAADPSAVCPPTASQVAGGLLRCGILVTDGSNGVLIALDYATTAPSGPPPPTGLAAPVTGISATPDGGGYWLVDAQGGVSTHGDAVNYGSMAGKTLNAPINHIVSTPSGRGYWLVASDGGTFAFGDAGFYGSMGGQPLNKPVVDIAPTSDGLGYWLVASDGGIFAFGDAAFYGSTGGMPINAPIMGMASDRATGGYWLVGSDGGIYSYNAPFYGAD